MVRCGSYGGGGGGGGSGGSGGDGGDGGGVEVVAVGVTTFVRVTVVINVGSAIVKVVVVVVVE